MSDRRYTHHCQRCTGWTGPDDPGWTWMSRIEHPVACPRCKNRNWDTPRTGTERGKKPKRQNKTPAK